MSSTISINLRRREAGEVWQERFFHRALRTVREYHEKVEYTHLNPVRRGLVKGDNYSPINGVRFVGANDGGSSAAFLLEMAQVLSNRKNKFTYWVVFFDGEEALKHWSASDSLWRIFVWGCHSGPP